MKDLAYDYDKQVWVEDRALLLSQLRDEVALLKSDQGRDFADFIGVEYNSYLADAEATLAEALK